MCRPGAYQPKQRGGERPELAVLGCGSRAYAALTMGPPKAWRDRDSPVDVSIVSRLKNNYVLQSVLYYKPNLR